ncbi:phage holin family protein [Pseudomonas vancouverensis]|uniref:Phage holin family protein n=2 Tax=Pseudomonas vancouverensis TaxID=95300 RepID=A0A4R4KJR5_PSEVA|nr:phage holin family protein [Pseudomonas vancouverensis]KAB0499959.1 phage holin family protein [Pseudomonas vancouverensis]TDB68448.1 phage holin family protein [Pseudomonas vancouverensis]
MNHQTEILIWITGLAHLIGAFRLACYQRDEQHPRWRARWLTSLCGGLFCLAGMDVLLKFAPVSPWHALVSVLVCALIVRARGNIRWMWQAGKS